VPKGSAETRVGDATGRAARTPRADACPKFKAALVDLSGAFDRSKSPRGGRHLRGRVRTEPRPATWLVQAPVPDRIHPSTPLSPFARVSCSSLCPAGLPAIALSSSRSPSARDGHPVRIRIEKDANRASDVVDRIGALVKKTPPRNEVVDLNAAILEVTALTQSEAVKSGVTLHTQLAGDLPGIRCDRVQPQQVMLNWIVNAIQSMSALRAGTAHCILALCVSTRRACAPRCGIPALGYGRRACRVSLNPLHDEARRRGHGPLDLTFDCRSHRGRPHATRC
jgi:hypothetical protein